jgi:HK97 family phage portal protein
MQTFQDNFFQNGAITGLIFTTDNTLSQQAKEKTLLYWSQRYSPSNGAKKPLILDSGMKPVVGLAQTFQEMDYDASIATHDTKILKALGVPPILLDGGNNANIAPNLRLFYLETVLPIINRYVSAMERYFGFDVAPVISNVSALQPEYKDIAQYHTTLVNGGVMTPNEAREELRLPADPDPESSKLRIPANIAGSAANPGVGGAPSKQPAKGN